MITMNQALKLRHGEILHYGDCKKIIGKRGGVKYYSENWRVNGMVKTWKTRPTHFRIPIKYGLYGYDYLDHNNCYLFHLESECESDYLTIEDNRT